MKNANNPNQQSRLEDYSELLPVTQDQSKDQSAEYQKELKEI